MKCKTREELGFHRDGHLLIIDDVVEVSERIQNMSHEERLRRIKILEEEGRKEREKITNRRTLLDI